MERVPSGGGPVRVTSTNIFIQSVILAALHFKHEWGMWLVPLGILHLVLHWSTAPRLVPVEPPGHSAARDVHSRTYRLHKPHAPGPPDMPQPRDWN